MAQLKQMLLEPGVCLYWVDTLVNLADPLTKEGLDTTLMKLAMINNEYAPEPTEEAIRRKEKQRADRARRKDEKKTTAAATTV